MKRLLVVLVKFSVVIGLGVLTAFVVVRLTVTREGVIVPEVIGKDVVAALEVANKHGLGLKITDRSYNVSAPTNHIISQDPRAGSWMKPEGIIRVVVSKGMGEVVVPAVQGAPWRDAKITLERYGLRVGEVIRVHTDRVARETVIAHDPPREAKIMKGGPVVLLVSEGPRAMMYVMPDLRGQPQYAAHEIVAAIGLRVEKVSYRERPEARAGSVIEQRPTAGGPVTTGQSVEFVLAKRETTPAGSIGTFTLFQHRVPGGPGPRRVQIVVVNAEENRQVFDEMRQSGGEVRVLVRVKGETIAKVYYDGVLVEERRIE
jgi:eukaryotic-like serine/threonine-protein kinase